MTGPLLRSRVAPLALVAMILTIDAVRGHVTSYLLFGLLDEVCHLATAVLVLDATTRWHARHTPPRFLLAALLASVLIDVDHVPMDLLSSDIITAGTPRPYTHSLTTMVVLLVATGVLRHRRSATPVAGVTVGVGLHLLRDLATAPVALWWPVAAHGLEVSYGWYAAVLVLAMLAGAVGRDRSGSA